MAIKNKKILLYHFSDKDIKGKLSPDFFGSNSYSLREKKSCNIKRIFFYLEKLNYEPRLVSNKYLYIVKIGKSQLYDFREDKLNLKEKFNNIYDILEYIKIFYKGIIYDLGRYSVANLFEDIDVYKKKVLKRYDNKK